MNSTQYVRKQPARSELSANGGSSTVEKALAILEAIARSSHGLSNLEVARNLGLDKSTTHRLLTSLARYRYVERDEATRQFVVGGHLNYMAWGAAPDPRPALGATLSDLVEVTAESASCSLLLGWRFHCIEHAPSPYELRYCPDVGKSYPLNAGATGKAIAAFLTPGEQQQLMEDLPTVRLTDRTIVDRGRFADELRLTREQGFAMSVGERVPGGCGISAPIFSRHGAVIGAVSISAVEGRCPVQTLTSYSPQLIAAARRITDHLTKHAKAGLSGEGSR